ncbi:SDR family oxidoreductase [Rhodococcus pyridinivorans]|uniref:SDR family oxidoreductase n=1 Tax=Rhodococcus pyridinivorans TaxID=103816 RepID=UPI001EE77A38|nr:SDR family oxidoreductase [Rhodococcus pyridinivorans]
MAIVTGGSRGIGRAIAEELVRAGAEVVIIGRRQADLEATAAALGAGCRWHVCHVADAVGAARCVAETVAEHGSVDLLVNNAAVNPQWSATLDVDAGMAAKMAETNLWAPLMWTQLVWDAHMRDHGGSVVNVASIGGMIASSHTGFYNATKAGLIHLTHQLATELAPVVRVNVVAPGFTATEMAASIPEPDRISLADSIPLGRLGRPSDIAAAVSFLLSDQANWITGSVLPVDGGYQHARKA